MFSGLTKFAIRENVTIDPSSPTLASWPIRNEQQMTLITKIKNKEKCKQILDKKFYDRKRVQTVKLSFLKNEDKKDQYEDL